MKIGDAPKISVILATEQYDTVRKTVAHLKSQSARDRLEIVLVVPSDLEADVIASELRGFCKYRTVEVGPIDCLSSARAAGVRHATGRIVAFAESHSYPDRDWAEALIQAHRKPWAAVGPSVGNANPGSMISWANLFLD